jgi:hypothetical protein
MQPRDPIVSAGNIAYSQAIKPKCKRLRSMKLSANLMVAIPLYGPSHFSSVVVGLLQAYMLRETNVKDICVDLAKASKIENT